MAIEDCTHQKMGFSPYILLQKYIILLLGWYRQKFYPTPPLKNFGTKAWLYGQVTNRKQFPPYAQRNKYLPQGFPRGFEGADNIPPLPFIYSLFPLISERSELIEVREQRAHSSSLRAVRTLTVCRGCCSLLGNLSPVGRKLPYYVPCWFSSGVARRGSSGAGVGQGFGLRIYLPFWYVGCQMRLEPVFLIFGKPRGILYFIVEHVLLKLHFVMLQWFVSISFHQTTNR